MLFLLDNFEHLIRAAPIVAELLVMGPHLKVLVTSRMPLHLSGEQEYAVPPLSVRATLTLLEDQFDDRQTYPAVGIMFPAVSNAVALS